MRLERWLDEIRLETQMLEERDLQALCQCHPDERVIPLPDCFYDEAVDQFGIETRSGQGYFLGDGAWVDPLDGKVTIIETLP